MKMISGGEYPAATILDEIKKETGERYTFAKPTDWVYLGKSKETFSATNFADLADLVIGMQPTKEAADRRLYSVAALRDLLVKKGVLKAVPTEIT